MTTPSKPEQLRNGDGLVGITGATGHLGRLVIARLKDIFTEGNIVALARTPAKAQDLGVEVREADYDRLDTLDWAFANIDTLLMISASDLGQRARQHRNVIEAAKRANVEWIIYTSLLHADTSPLGLLAEEHRETEAALRASEIPFTLLRNGWYTENYTDSIPGALAGGAFLGSADNGKISGAARADFADAAVAVVSTEGHMGMTYELAGDQAFTLSDLAAEISRQTGKSIPYRDMPQADYAAALMNFGLPEAAALSIAGYDVGAAQGALFDDSHQLSRLIGHPTTPLSVMVAEALSQMGQA